jgi:tetratricopeptide (TPR) repeat protein
VQEINLSTDIINTDNKGSSDWYLAQLSKLSIDKKEIPNLIKQQLKVIKELYEIKPQYGKYYIFTNTPNVKADDLREQILRLIEVSPEAKEVLEDSNAYTTNESIKVTENIISNLPSLSTYNLIIRNEILQKIEETLNEKRFVTVSAFAGTGKSTISIEYGSKQRDEAKKIVRFIYADSADKIFEAYRQLAKEFAIYTIGEKEEDIIRLVHERIANLRPAILFIFDNVEKYKDIESYLNGIMNMPNDKTQVIITTRNNNLGEDITNIELKPFNREEAILYLVESLGDRLNEQDISNLLAELSSEDAFILPYSLSKAVAYLKENKLLKVDDYINYFKNSKDDHIETVLLLQLLEKSPLAWQILQYSAHLDPDFISIEIFKELFLIDEEKLQEAIKRLEELSLMNLIYQNEQAGLQLHRLVQSTVKRYVKKHTEFVTYEQKVRAALIEVLDNLLPQLTAVPNKDWENAKLLYPHIIKILSDDIEIDKFRRANLYKKLGYYNEHVLCKFEDSLKYHKEALEIYQALYQGNHPFIAQSLDNVGIIYSKLGNVKEELKYLKEALRMSKKLYPINRLDIAATLNNVGIAYMNSGNFSKALEYLKKALKIGKELHKGDHSLIASSLSNIGEIYIDLGDIFKALIYYKEALKIFQELPCSDPSSIAMILNNIGRVYRILGNFSESLKYLKEALNILQNLYKHPNPRISTVLGNIGLAYQGLGDISEGLKYLKEALKINQELYQGNHSSIANFLNNIGSAYQDLGDISEGLKYQEAALEMLQELPCSDPSSIARVLNNIGLASQIPQGLKYLEAALKTFQTVFQWNHSYAAGFLFNIGLAYEKLKDINKSTELYKQSYLMFIQTLGLEHHYSKSYSIRCNNKIIYKEKCQQVHIVKI